MFATLLRSTSALLALTTVLAAQTTYAIQGATTTAVEMSGPPAGACAYPDGPIASFFNYAQAPICGGVGVPGPFATFPALGGTFGDIAFDRAADQVWVTDGMDIACYDAPTGQLVEHFPAAFAGLAGPLTGLGFDAATGWLWVCDAGGYAALLTNGGCAPVPVFGPAPSPAGLAALGDIDVDSNTGLLWVCDSIGNVANFPAGAGAWTNLFNIAGAIPGCGGVMTPVLTGLACDPSTAAPDFTVTNGAIIARLVEVGAGAYGAAVPDFARPDVCWPAPAGPALSGLAQTAHAVTYGPATGPVLGSYANSTLPGPGFKLELTGVPVSNIFLLVDLGASCPAVPVLGNPGLIAFSPVWFFVGPVPIAVPGQVTVGLPLPGPGVLPQGGTLYMQVFVNSAAGGWSSSNGLAFTTSLP